MPTDEQEEQIHDADLSFTSPSVVIATETNIESVPRAPIVKLLSCPFTCGIRWWQCHDCQDRRMHGPDHPSHAILTVYPLTCYLAIGTAQLL